MTFPLLCVFSCVSEWWSVLNSSHDSLQQSISLFFTSPYPHVFVWRRSLVAHSALRGTVWHQTRPSDFLSFFFFSVFFLSVLYPSAPDTWTSESFPLLIYKSCLKLAGASVRTGLSDVNPPPCRKAVACLNGWHRMAATPGWQNMWRLIKIYFLI